jgi:hypothetical protein
MAGATISLQAVLRCPHGVQITIEAADQRVMAGHAAVATRDDIFTIVGCPFQLPTTPPIPSPCVRVQWLEADTRVQRGGSATLSETSVGLCLNAQGLPQGPVVVAFAPPGVTSE